MIAEKKGGYMTDVRNFSEAEVKKALELLQKVKEQRKRQAEKLRNNPKYKELQKKQALRQRAKLAILKEKALKAGITVTDAEIENWIKANTSVKK